MAANNSDYKKTLSDLRLDRSDIQLAQRFMRKGWFMKVATRLAAFIEDDIKGGKFKREDLYLKSVWHSPLYILVLGCPLREELVGDFGKDFPPENALKDSWLPAVLGPLLTVMQGAPLDPKFLPYLRAGKEIVDMKTRATNYEAREDMEPRVFHLEKEFLLWEKYQIENQA